MDLAVTAAIGTAAYFGYKFGYGNGYEEGYGDGLLDRLQILDFFRLIWKNVHLILEQGKKIQKIANGTKIRGHKLLYFLFVL